MVKLVDQPFQARKELVIDRFSLLKRVALDKNVNQPRLAPPAEAAWYAGQIIHRTIDFQLAIAQQPADPRRRHSKQAGLAPELEHHSPRRSFVEPGGGEKIMLPGAQVDVVTIVERDPLRHLRPPQRPQPGMSQLLVRHDAIKIPNRQAWNNARTDSSGP